MKARIKSLIDTALPKIISSLGCESGEAVDYDIESPKREGQGDLATNLAFRLAKRLKRAPISVAADIKKILEEEVRAERGLKDVVRKIDTAPPGFVNFYFAEGAAHRALYEIRRRAKTYGVSQEGRGEKVLIEFVSANPTGPLTIAHGRQAVVGDALARILTAAGYKVTREYYVNDAGRQMRILGESVLARYAEKMSRTFAVPEDGYQGEYITQLAEAFRKEAGDRVSLDEKGAARAGRAASDELMRSIKADLKRLRISFDRFFSESGLHEEKIADTIETLKQKGHLYEKDGALWFRSTALGDDKDRVIRKSDGSYTYLAPDIAYHRDKFERGNDMLINLLGPDHHGYVARLKAACDALGFASDRLHVLLVQLVTLYRGGEPYRMSTRAGAFVTLRELMDEVGVDATRIFFIQRRIDSHLDFDIDLAKKHSDENPVYYLQYAHARISSILAFAERPVPGEVDLTLLEEPETVLLIRHLQHFPDRIAQAARNLEPIQLLQYLRELAQHFHKFYACHRVVTDDEARTDARLLLIDAVRVVLGNGLALLGVDAPEKM